MEAAPKGKVHARPPSDGPYATGTPIKMRVKPPKYRRVIALDGRGSCKNVSPTSPPICPPMKFPFLSAAVLAGCVALGSSGCALITQGRQQTVVIRSTPSGATAKINDTVVGVTPFKVKLKRDEVFRVDLEKKGFASEAAILLPSSTNYDQRFLRWGLDYDLGVATELVPTELALELKPALGEVTGSDRFAEMTAQIVRADAMLASGELTTEDHKYLVEKIIATYQRN